MRPAEPFDLVEPRGAETPVVVEVPHAGLGLLDAEAMAFTLAPARSLARDADLYVDVLFEEAPLEGASLLVARTSRYVLDLNRGEADFDREAAEGGGAAPLPRGLVWRLTTEGEPSLAGPLPRAELERRLSLVYRPYHAALRALLEAKRKRFGYAVLLCAHSMPSRGRRGHLDAGSPRADIVPGSRSRTTAAGVFIDAVDAHAREAGFTVRHDDPYRGGFSTGHYGRPAEGLHAVQVEIGRQLYMNEETCLRDSRGFGKVRAFARGLVARLASTKPPASGGFR